MSPVSGATIANGDDATTATTPCFAAVSAPVAGRSAFVRAFVIDRAANVI
jgi:hypothetical protein